MTANEMRDLMAKVLPDPQHPAVKKRGGLGYSAARNGGRVFRDPISRTTTLRLVNATFGQRQQAARLETGDKGHGLCQSYDPTPSMFLGCP